MFDGQSPNQEPPRRLILPASSDASASPEQMTQRAPTLPEHLAARPTQLVPPPNHPRLTKSSIPAMPRVAPPGSVKSDWRKDPAYKFLFVAIGVVLIAGILFMLFAGSALASLFNLGGAGQTNAGGPVQGPVNTQPTFPVSSGSTPTSQPTSMPTPQPSPTTVPSPTPLPTQQPTATQNPQLAVQIVNVVAQVSNGSTVPVTVNATQANVQVQLHVTYNTTPFNTNVGPQLADGNGNVTFQWNVKVQPLGHYQILAYLTAIARNQNGQQVMSQTVTVKVAVKGGIVGG